jgi:hypothetical protein
MIRIEHNEYGSCPIVVCDHCQKQIVEAKDGAYFFDMPLKTWNGQQVDILFAHYNRCFDQVETRMKNGGSDLVGWIPLSAFPIYLERNLKLDRKKAIETATALSLI